MYNYVLQCQQSEVTLRNILVLKTQEQKNDESLTVNIAEIAGIIRESNAINDSNANNVKNKRSRSKLKHVNKSEKSEHSEDDDDGNDIASAETDSEDSTKECNNSHSKAKVRRQNTRNRKTNTLYTCHKCNVSFETMEEIREHRRKMKHPRTRLRNHICTVCNKAFQYSHLLLHMRTHTMEKPHECNICQMRFSVPCNLKRHMMTHTGERPHKCELCGKGTKNNNFIAQYDINIIQCVPKKCAQPR